MPQRKPIAPIALIDPADAVAGALAALLPVHAATSTARLADATAAAAERLLGAAETLLFLDDPDGRMAPAAPLSDARRQAHHALLAALGAGSPAFDAAAIPAVAEALDTGAPVVVDAAEMGVAGQAPAAEAACAVPLEAAGERLGAMLAFGGRDMNTHRLRLLAEHTACAAANLRSAATAAEAPATLDVARAVFDQRKIEAELQRELARAARYQREVSICVIEATNLRLLRERFGEALTEQLLGRLGEALAHHAREIDVIGAYKESGYTMVLTEASASGAEAAARRLRAEVDGMTLEMGTPVPGLELHLAAGWATAPADGSSVEALFGAAEQRMYRQAA